MHPDDAKELGVRRRPGSPCRLSARRGPGARGNPRTQQAAARTCLRARFDAEVLINKVTLDATDPISKQADFKKCAVKIIPA